MKSLRSEQAAEFLQKRKKRKIWYRIVVSLAVVVVFVTTYMLILPAITMEKDAICGLEVHQHTEECFDVEGNLICGLEEHLHTEACMQKKTDENGVEEVSEEITEAVAADQNVTEEVLVNSAAEDENLSEEILEVPEEDAPDVQNVVMLSVRMPLRVEDYLDKQSPGGGVQLKYKLKDSNDWQQVTTGVQIPGDASLRLEVDYAGVSVADLKANGYEMTFTLPEVMRNATTQGTIISDGQTAGVITVSEQTVTLKFNPSWVDGLSTQTIKGDFYVESDIDLTWVDNNDPDKIVIGDVEIGIDFEDDLVAEYGDVDVVKSAEPKIEERDDGDFLVYTITVTAGEDGAKEVSVTDTFTGGNEYIEDFVEFTSDVGTISKSGDRFTWYIGDMSPNEVRTLRYKVKLRYGYTGGKIKDNLYNTAVVWSGDNKKDEDWELFTPKATGTVVKRIANNGDFTPNENGDGGGTIKYAIEVTADSSNTYNLRELLIEDSLNRGGYQTDSKYLEYLSYDPNSFRLDGQPITPYISDDGHFFSYTLNQELTPGQKVTLTYTLNVDAGIFTKAGNIVDGAGGHDNDIAIGNHAYAKIKDFETDEYHNMHHDWEHHYFSKKSWARKEVGQKQENSLDVPMSGNVYDATGDTISQITDPDAQFTVPAGSYQYQVVVNEAGDWDVSAADMSDTFSQPYMEFVGYVRVDAYNSNESTPVQTVWVKVGGNSFQFTPREIGLWGNQKYVMTYYAQPVRTDEFTQIEVANEFDLGGWVWIGDTWYWLTGIKTSASVVIEGNDSFTTDKIAWYYAPVDDLFDKGALYWGIKVDGTKIKNGVQFRDDAAIGEKNHSIMENASFIGVYTGNLGEQGLEGYPNWEELQKSGKLTEVEESAYSVTYEGTGVNAKMVVTLNQDISLNDGDSLYILVKTKPHKFPDNPRDFITFKNQVDVNPGNSWITNVDRADKVTNGTENIFKKLGKVFAYDGNGKTIDEIQSGEVGKPILSAIMDGKDWKMEPGTYAAWMLKVNYEGGLNGTYRITEQIPEGMEITYVRLKWEGYQYTAEPKPKLQQISNPENGWQEHCMTATTDNNGIMDSYYYVDGNNVYFDVSDLYPGKTEDNHAVDIQVVCRVIDDALLNGQETEFNNRVTLQNQDGIVIGEDQNSVTITGKTLSKEGTYDATINGGIYPFKLTINPLGEDLVEGADTITLVDEMSERLILDTSSIVVVNSKTNEAVEFKASLEGRTLKIELPDNRPLTVTYKTRVSAAPGEIVSISNNAHWEGYTTPSGGSVEVPEFSYSAGGTVSGQDTPKIILTKKDQYDLQKTLAGAEFEMREGTWNGGNFTPVDGREWTGTTGEDGTLTFGEAEPLMKFNTVYCIWETTAPDGYVLDDAPHYFAVAKADDNENYPEELRTWAEQGVDVFYGSATYLYEMKNHKGEVEVIKRFQDADGNLLPNGINGTYRFGIYDNEEADGEPLQVKEITYEDGTVNPEGGKATFTNLDLGRTYYIYELDDENKPIRNHATATADDKIFDVIYTGGIDDDENGAEPDESGTTIPSITVTNQMSQFALPETGGAGNRTVMILGITLVLCAVLGYTKRINQRNESEGTL